MADSIFLRPARPAQAAHEEAASGAEVDRLGLDQADAASRSTLSNPDHRRRRISTASVRSTPMSSGTAKTAIPTIMMTMDATPLRLR